jgi:glyoxylase-like metal-dependent hydrolase (beta-lactamase superfamily II)
MEVYFVNAENFKLDGGACFGVVPKSMWSKVYSADENNMLSCSLRNLLIKDGSKLYLFDTGIGNKQNEKFLNNFYVSGFDNLVNSIKEKGFSPDDVTDVVFTHLHFDHCGGAFRKNEKGEIEPVFKNASYICSRPQYLWAVNANVRERASYLLENLEPIIKSGRLLYIHNEYWVNHNLLFKLFNGHTEGLMLPLIKINDKTLVYMGDFIPTILHISLPYVASFDTRPLVSMQEKNSFLKEAAEKNYILLFQHDAYNECCTVQKTEKGIRVKESGRLEHFFTNPDQKFEKTDRRAYKS